MKWYQAIFTLLIGVGIGILLSSYWPEPDQTDIEDPIIHKYKEEIGWRDLNEKKTTKRIESLIKDSVRIAKENLSLRAKANHSDAKLKDHRNEPIPLTTHDTISFLMEDTTLCDSALADSKKLVNGLTAEIITDNSIIKGQAELIDSLQTDKKDLIKIDSLNQIDKKRLRKANRKKFFRGLGIGGVLGAIVALLL